jgi:low affinity Fe/Cu permease
MGLNLSFQTPVKGILVYMPPSFPHLPFNETWQLTIWTPTTFWPLLLTA